MRRSRSLDAVLGMKLPIANFGFDFRKAVPRQTARLKTRRLLHPDSRKFYVGCTYAEGARSAVIIASI